ncbi:MAG: cytochrome P450 [Leptospiraceae bacterium]|nr:cytochrome P450 [Leptospiraceae bacterium]
MSKVKVPGPPKSHFIFGNLSDFQKNPPEYILNTAKKYGNISAIDLAGFLCVIVNEPEVIKDIMMTNQKQFVKAHAFRIFKKLLGEGLLTSEGEFHKRQKRLAQPAFFKQRIHSYGPGMVDYINRTQTSWKDGETIDLHTQMTDLTLGVVTKTLFNTEVGTAESRALAESITAALEIFDEVLASPFADFILKIPFLPITMRLKKAIKKLDKILYQIIDEHRTHGGDQGDFISMMMLAKDEEGTGSMSNKQIRDEAITIFLAGHETTANALCWTFYLLAKNPDKRKKFLAEIDSVLGGKKPTVEDVPKLTYTLMVFSEALRMYPPVWWTGRENLEEYTIGDYKFKKGTIFVISQYAMHHDERFYSDPYTFRPERWLPEEADARPKFAFFPFGAGIRMCIGNQFAEQEAILALASLSQDWLLHIEEEKQVLSTMLTLRPKDGMKVKLERRKK